ncbi:uncharacterized protein LOC135935797 [Cloeon dipterum]|uniref:uncharacterized protein LOC135935797 n=1 Tax=Cloeon dipterum TaxID=197152 RepID=UPI0032209244
MDLEDLDHERDWRGSQKKKLEQRQHATEQPGRDERPGEGQVGRRGAAGRLKELGGGAAAGGGAERARWRAASPATRALLVQLLHAKIACLLAGAMRPQDHNAPSKSASRTRMKVQQLAKARARTLRIATWCHQWQARDVRKFGDRADYRAVADSHDDQQSASTTWPAPSPSCSSDLPSPLKSPPNLCTNDCYTSNRIDSASFLAAHATLRLPQAAVSTSPFPTPQTAFSATPASNIAPSAALSATVFAANTSAASSTASTATSTPAFTTAPSAYASAAFAASTTAPSASAAASNAAAATLDGCSPASDLVFARACCALLIRSFRLRGLRVRLRCSYSSPSFSPPVRQSSPSRPPSPPDPS